MVNRRQMLRRRIKHRREAARISRKGPPKLRIVGGVLLAFTFLSAGIGALVAYSFYQDIADDFVDPATLIQQNTVGLTKIYDRHGVLIAELPDPKANLRDPVPLSEISEFMKWATISAEDATFYTNPGINYKGLARAAYENFFDREAGFFKGSGGSSITQQLVKNVLIPEDERTDRSLNRKLREAIFAIELNRKYSKDQILEWYLNQISYAGRYNGVEAAARGYFRTTAKDLTLAQAAFLAGIPASPSEYHPRDSFPAGKRRQEEVLRLMVQEGYITEVEANRAANEELVIYPDEIQFEAPHFVISQVEPRLVAMCEKGLIDADPDMSCDDVVHRSALQVTTTLDLQLTYEATDLLRGKIYYWAENGCQCSNSALVSIVPETGEVLVYVGGLDYNNEAILGDRDQAVDIQQPGSSFKPMVYLANFIHLQRNPLTIIWDIPTSYGGVQIVNPNGGHSGPLTIRAALGGSQNVPATKAAEQVGIENVIATAKAMGITTLNEQEISYGPAIATGGANVTVFDMAYMNATVANTGVMVGEPTVFDRDPTLRQLDPVIIKEIRDANGKVVYSQPEPTRIQVVSAQHAFLLQSIMTDCTSRFLIWGCGALDLADGRPSGVKTGTQQGLLVNQTLETWTNGFTMELASAVWVGNTDNSLMAPNLASPLSATDIYLSWMNYYHDKYQLPHRDFPIPEGVTRDSVLVPKKDNPCNNYETGWVVIGEEPKKEQFCEKVVIDIRNGKRATDATPEIFRVEKEFLVIKDDPAALAWARANGWPLAPEELSDGSTTLVAITHPADGAKLSPTAVVEITGQVATPDLESWTLEVCPGTSLSGCELIASGATAVTGNLGSWDPKGKPTGTYTIVIRAKDKKPPYEYLNVVTVTLDDSVPTPTPTGTPSATASPVVTPTPTLTPTIVVPTPTPTLEPEPTDPPAEEGETGEGTATADE